jgi:hypothetical protein
MLRLKVLLLKLNLKRLEEAMGMAQMPGSKDYLIEGD